MPPYEPPDQPDPEQTPAPARGGIGELIVRWLQGEATPEEEESLREWRRSSPTRDQYCRDLERTWQLVGGAAAPGEVPGWPAAVSGVDHCARESRRARTG